MKITSQRGMALVTSLIMLGLVTMLAIAFIALARRDRASVEVTKKTTEAKMMADASLARAQAEVMGRLKDNINLQMLVSTNGPVTSPTIDPRVPVVYTVNGQPEERFFLNLNRDSDTNGRPLFQPTAGAWMDSNPAKVPYSGRQNLIYQPPAGGGFVGDPQWIGVLEDPSQPHGPDNRFIGRYAYMVVPASKALDLNRIHNGPLYQRASGSTDMELNLAAVLGQADGTVWTSASYPYQQSASAPDRVAWSDAIGLLNYRQTSPWVKDIHDLLTLPGAYAPFSQRLKVATTNNPYAFYKLAATLTTVSFPPKTAKFDLNDPSNPPPEIYFREVANRLLQGSLISNVNAGVTNYHIGSTNGPVIGTSVTNFNPATFNLANIQVYPANQYTPEVHRLLQLAANITDARKNAPPVPPPVVPPVEHPLVFRPVLREAGGQVFFNGFVEEANAGFLTSSKTLHLPADIGQVNVYPNSALLGVVNYPNGTVSSFPILIASRRKWTGGHVFPNFNEVSIQTTFSADFTPAQPAIPNVSPAVPAQSKLEISAVVAVETWNSSWNAPILNLPLTRMITNALSWRVNGAPPSFLAVGQTNAAYPNSWYRLDPFGPYPIWATNHTGNAALAKYPNMTVEMANWTRYALIYQGKVVDYASVVLTNTVQRDFPERGPNNKDGKDVTEISWQVNDPFVNNLASDLAVINYPPFLLSKTVSTPPPQMYFAPQNSAYQPWGGGGDNMAVKDINVANAFRWNFPSGVLQDFGSIGQVHRGTPWQSVYFKSWPSGIAWPLSPDSHPTNDWRLADLFAVTSAVNASLLSVNQTNDTAWAAALAPISLVTPPEDRLNAGTHDYLIFPFAITTAPATITATLPAARAVLLSNNPPTYYLIPASHPNALYFRQDNLLRGAPYNPYQNSGCDNTVAGNQLTHLNVNATVRVYDQTMTAATQTSGNTVRHLVATTAVPVNLAQFLTDRINTHRTSTLTQAPYPSVGQVLGAPELTLNFPPAFTANWSTDSDYERVPAQILSLLKVEEEPAVVIYAWGQSLKPADKSVAVPVPVVISGANIGQINNYTVTGQVGTRTVLRVKNFNPAITNQPPRMVVESFRVLP